MTTAQDIITDSLKELRVYAPGEPIDDADLADGLTQLNRLLDHLSNDSAACYALLEQSLPLQIGKASYTVGPGGDLNSTRPLRLIYGPGAAYILDANQVKYQVDVWPQDKWNTIAYPTQSADFPTIAFYDPQFPIGIVNVFPTPSQAFTFYFDSYLQLGNLTNYTSQILFPPGYEAMLQKNLSVWLKPWYKGAQLDPIVERLAIRTLASVKRTNKRQNMAEFDPELLVRGTAAYNVYSDSYVR